MILTLITMVAEIIYGYITNSMALSADGYHMGTHLIALSMTLLAYFLIKKFQNSPSFPKGPDKIGTISAYTSAWFLGFGGVWIIIESFNRFLNPVQIDFNDAIIVAIIGLVVNGIGIFIMDAKHEHNHNHFHNHAHAENEDYNFKAAYYHILADALTSVLAIIALLVGKYFGFVRFDALIGIFGGILILKWAIDLIKNTLKILIDMKIKNN